MVLQVILKLRLQPTTLTHPLLHIANDANLRCPIMKTLTIHRVHWRAFITLLLAAKKVTHVISEPML